MRLETQKCRVCGCNDYYKLMTLYNMPKAVQKMPSIDELDEDYSLDLDLCQCKRCGLVQFPIEPVNYYKDVIRAGGGTSTMYALRLEEYSRLLKAMETFGIEGRNIVEVGCGKGEFLRMWKDVDSSQKLDVCGIEHSIDLVKSGLEDNLLIEQNFAEGENTYFNKKFDAFVQFNFLEHQPYPADMLRNIWKNLNDEALGLITVPSFEYILKNDGYYELMRDHISYFTIESLTFLLNNNGFEVLESRMVNRDTIEVLVKKTELVNNCAEVNVKLVDASRLIDNYEELQDTVKQYSEKLDESNKTLAIWGASHQTFTLAATTDLAKCVSYIIDSAEFKQGKYAQASHLKIVSPSYFHFNPVDEILIVAPGYTEEIAQTIKTKYGDKVKILILKDRSIKDYLTGELI